MTKNIVIFVENNHKLAKVGRLCFGKGKQSPVIRCFFAPKLLFMLYKTRGIALSYIRYRESSIIAKIYTEEFGLQSYIINGVRSAKSKTNRIAFFQPLTLLDLVVYHKNKEQTLHRLSEVKCSLPFKSLPFDFVKASMAMFVTEILVKTLQEESKDELLFQFLSDSVQYLEEAESQFEGFHLRFLSKLASFLGFGADHVAEVEEQLSYYQYPYAFDSPTREALQVYVLAPYDYAHPLDRERRNQLLNALLFFYKIHLEGLGEIRSLEVLRELMK